MLLLLVFWSSPVLMLNIWFLTGTNWSQIYHLTNLLRLTYIISATMMIYLDEVLKQGFYVRFLFFWPLKVTDRYNIQFILYIVYITYYLLPLTCKQTLHTAVESRLRELVRYARLASWPFYPLLGIVQVSITEALEVATGYNCAQLINVS